LADAGYGAGNGGLIAGTIRVLDRFARGDAPATGA
jgi:hypothetical protein